MVFSTTTCNAHYPMKSDLLLLELVSTALEQNLNFSEIHNKILLKLKISEVLK
jgi:uncharacterized protein (DUF952 family)